MTKLETAAAVAFTAVFLHGGLKATFLPYSGWFWAIVVQANS